jgi:heme-degrading monooxygenase HmoA
MFNTVAPTRTGSHDRRATPSPRLWLPWAAGPEERTAGPVLVSVTEFTMQHPRDLFGITTAALRLRQGWYGLPGAVGLYLWAAPLERRSGSVSVWTNREDLRRWVGLPLHVAIMRRYRTRGSLESTTWSSPAFDRASVHTEATRRISRRDYA